MTAILGGLGASIIWAVGSIGASRSARGLGSMNTLAWVMLVGLVLTALVLPFSGHAAISATSALWLFIGGAGNVGGLLLMYRGLRIAQLGVVMPIVTAAGGIAALIAIVAGQGVGPVRGVAVLTVMIGVLTIAAAARPVAASSALRSNPPDSAVAACHPTGEMDRHGAAWATAGTLCFGASQYAIGRAGAVLPVAWAVIPPRVVGVIAVTLPLAFRRQLRRPGRCAPWLLLSGSAEVAGFFSYTFGARASIAVAAVLSTLTGAFATAAGRFLFGERLHIAQFAGGALILVGVAALSAVSA